MNGQDTYVTTELLTKPKHGSGTSRAISGRSFPNATHEIPFSMSSSAEERGTKHIIKPITGNSLTNVLKLKYDDLLFRLQI